MATLLVASNSLQPLVLCHGRLQRLHALTSLRTFGAARPAGALLPALAWPGAAAVVCSPGGPAPPAWAAWPSKTHRRRAGGWRCLAVQPLAAPAAGAGAAAAAPRHSIRPGEVHLWWLDPRQVAGEAELQRCREMLTPEELQDCTAADTAAEQRQRTLARALVRSVLAGYLPGAPHPRTLLFSRNTHGKPRLTPPPGAPEGPRLRFNLTHTPSMIGLAVTVEGVVGLDVEALQRRTRRDPMRLAQRRFSQQEIADLQACPDEASRAAYFLQLWTLKEAYVKAIGRGISAPPGLRSFSFRVGLTMEEPAGGSGQEQRPPNVLCAAPSARRLVARSQQLVVQPPTAWCNTSGSLGSGSGSGSGTPDACSSGSVDFSCSVPDGRRWLFALLQPAPGLLGALCLELTSGQPGEQLGQLEGGLRLLSFEAAPWSGHERLVDTQVLAVGAYPPGGAP